ncbi:hypothetical protein ACJMK2_038814, partial [Sinanodonta woodiana]
QDEKASRCHQSKRSQSPDNLRYGYSPHKLVPYSMSGYLDKTRPDITQNHPNPSLGHTEYHFRPIFPPIHLHPVEEGRNGVCPTGAQPSEHLIIRPMPIRMSINNVLSGHSQFHTPARHAHNQRTEHAPDSAANNSNINSGCASSSLTPSGESKYSDNSTRFLSPDPGKRNNNRITPMACKDLKKGFTGHPENSTTVSSTVMLPTSESFSLLPLSMPAVASMPFGRSYTSTSLISSRANDDDNISSPLLELVYEKAASLILKSVKWVKGVTSFLQLPHRDQAILLEVSWCDLFIITASQYSFSIDV